MPQTPADIEPVAVDVIILSWNRVEDTIAAIASAAAQKDVERQIFVVDQGSNAENLSRLEEFVATVPSVVLQKLEKNSGVAGGRNIATRMGKARYIVALDSDAIFADDHVLAKVVAHLDMHSDLCAVGFRITNFFTRENDATSWDYPAGRSPASSFPTTRFIGAGHAIRRSTFEQVGGYDDRLFFCGEELDLCYRMLNTGKRIQYFADAEILHKVSPEHRVYWGKGRFFYTVRNNLYTMHKFNTSYPRLLLAGAAFVAKGITNGIGNEAVRGIRESFRMSHAYDRDVPDKSPYRLSIETWNHIHSLEPSRSESVWKKLARQLKPLPNPAKE